MFPIELILSAVLQNTSLPRCTSPSVATSYESLTDSRNRITATGHGRAADYWAYGVLLFELLAGYPPFFDDNPLGIYEKILNGKFSFPNHLDFVVKDLIKRLLMSDLSKRLGNLKEGARGVRSHRWFEGVDWEMVIRKEIKVRLAHFFPFSLLYDRLMKGYDVIGSDYSSYINTGRYVKF